MNKWSDLYQVSILEKFYESIWKFLGSTDAIQYSCKIAVSTKEISEFPDCPANSRKRREIGNEQIDIKRYYKPNDLFFILRTHLS